MGKYIFTFILLVLLTSCNSGNSGGNTDAIKNNNGVIENKFTLMTPLLKNVTDKDGIARLYLSRCLISIGPDKLGIIVPRNQILIISAEDGKVIKRFGKEGSGPGEFKFNYIMKYFDGIGLIALDLLQMKMMLFYSDFNYRKDIKTRGRLNDLVILDDTRWISANFEQIKGYKPIQLFNPLNGNIINKFGGIIDPQKDIYDVFAASPLKGTSLEMVSTTIYVGLLLLPDKKTLIYSQSNPYSLVKYDLNSMNQETFSVPAPYSTTTNFGTQQKGPQTQILIGKAAKVSAPFIYKDNVAVFIFSPDMQNNYMDLYDKNLKFAKRYKVPPLDKSVKTVGNAFIKNNIAYIHVLDKDRTGWIERLKFEE
jgi:hypothetical protein